MTWQASGRWIGDEENDEKKYYGDDDGRAE